MPESKEKTLDILNKQGYEYYKNKDYAGAISYYNKYIELNQTNPVIYNMLGYLYQKLAPYEEIERRIECFEKALELNPKYTQAIRNLAFAYPLVGKYSEAINCFHKLFNEGAVTDDYFAYACLKLRLGDFEEGWKYFDARFLKVYGKTDYPEIDKPRWEGQEIKDKTLLVQFEQGFGDSIQFFRYLEQLKPIAKKIIFRVQNELVELFKINTDIEIIGEKVPVKEISFDYHIPLMSLPYILKATLQNIPFSQGYIKADEKKFIEYKKEFFDNDCFKIGISWHGTNIGNINRNIPLSSFYSLTELKNVKIYSLQKVFDKNDLERLPNNIEIVNLGKSFSDFSDTAAAMANLDLFITSDNSVLNLAGAMGKKTFLLLNKFAEWRWMFDEEKTPWYKSVKIFKKQNELDNWDLLIKKVIEDIKKEPDYKV